MRIDSIEIKDLWGFGNTGNARLDQIPMTAVLIGRNNAGKSSFVRTVEFLRTEVIPHLPKHLEVSTVLPPDAVHRNIDGSEGHPIATIRICFEQAEIERHLRSTRGQGAHLPHIPPQLYATLRLAFDKRRGSANAVTGSLIVDDCDPAKEPGKTLRTAAAELLGTSIIHLNGWRRLHDNSSVNKSFIRSLHEYGGAKSHEYAKHAVFEKVQHLFQRLTQLKEAQIVPVHDGTDITVKWRRRHLSIASFGDGIAHLLMIAFELASGDGKVLFIEEPETHLHPQLQRELFRFIKAEQQNNQVVMTTHSPVLLDEGQADGVYLVTHDLDVSQVERISTPPKLYSILSELDIRASDLLQANVAIWVEGPSDRLLLRKCLSFVASELREGVDYQFVFYAGSLRAHLTAIDEGELVNILRLARHVVMVTDSDKTHADATLSSTKRRLHRECDTAGAYSWVTEGREIENYLDPVTVTKTIHGLTGRTIDLSIGLYDDFADNLRRAFDDPPEGKLWVADYDSHKVRLMQAFVTEMTAVPDRFDLRSQLDSLVKYIRGR